ncbi:rho guanine nucleotide exchange factor 5-like, partial [Pteropus vampyrus]|uniref:Rho guanine nucleotide exchange factor 5-like n=1 Tax=Pteropus vampyrus TaxID=132908 RepID=A0A6P3RPX9_PTEVA
TQREGNQSLVGESVNVAAEQEHEALRGKLMPEEEEEDEEEAEAAAAAAGSSEEEPASWEGAALPGAGVERSTARGEERDGPPTRTPVAPEVSSPCDLLPDTWDATARIPGTQTEPGAEELSPVALTPTLEPVGRSLQAISLPSSFPVLESSDQETAQDSRQEGPTLGEGAASSRATEVASGSASDTPPRTPGWGPCSPAEASTCTTASPPASPPVAVPRKKPSLAACSPDTSGAFSLTDQPPLWGASDTLPAPLHGCPAAEASMDPWASPPSPPATSAGAARHPRSSSFPGSHRTQPAPDLAGASLSFSHSELPQRPPKPSVSGSVIPRRDRKSSRGCSSIPESPSSLSIWGQVPRESTLSPERPGSPRSAQPWGSLHNSAFAPGLPAYGSSAPFVLADMPVHEPPPPPPPERRHVHPVVERDGHLVAISTLRQCSYPPPLALSLGPHGPPKCPLPEVPDPLVARQYRPLPSTPDSPCHPQTSFSPKLRYNKPLPPTPDLLQPQHPPLFPDNNPRIYRPLPAVPIVDPLTEPPPLPPKSRGRNRSIQGGLVGSGGPAKPRPVCQEWTVSTSHSVGRTSWPPATGRSVDSLASTSRSKSEVAPGMAFSNVTALLSPSSPTTPWTLELQDPVSEAGLSEGSRAHAGGSLRRTARQEGANSLRQSDLGRARQPEKPSHPHLEKASSWPHRRDAGRPAEGSSGQAAVSGEGSSKHKGWHRQGVRRPSILPEGAS